MTTSFDVILKCSIDSKLFQSMRLFPVASSILWKEMHNTLMKNFRTQICATPLILTSMVKKYNNNLLFCILKKTTFLPPPLTFTTHTVKCFLSCLLSSKFSRNNRQTKAKILIVYSVNIINDAIIAEISTCSMAKRMQINL